MHSTPARRQHNLDILTYCLQGCEKKPRTRYPYKRVYNVMIYIYNNGRLVLYNIILLPACPRVNLKISLTVNVISFSTLGFLYVRK